MDMLKRKQVLIEDWMVDYLKKIARKYDISFSEIIRIHLSMSIGCASKHMYGCDFDFCYKENIADKTSYLEGGDLSANKKLLSEIYFQVRKCIEQRMKKKKN